MSPPTKDCRSAKARTSLIPVCITTAEPFADMAVLLVSMGGSALGLAHDRRVQLGVADWIGRARQEMQQVSPFPKSGWWFLKVLDRFRCYTVMFKRPEVSVCCTTPRCGKSALPSWPQTAASTASGTWRKARPSTDRHRKGAMEHPRRVLGDLNEGPGTTLLVPLLDPRLGERR